MKDKVKELYSGEQVVRLSQSTVRGLGSKRTLGFKQLDNDNLHKYISKCNMLGMSVASICEHLWVAENSTTVTLFSDLRILNEYENMFYGTEFTQINLDGLYNHVVSLSGLFEKCSATKIDFGNTFKTEFVYDFKDMFHCCKNLKEVNFRNIDTRSVQKMNDMFQSCESLESIDLTTLDLSSVDDVGYMFEDCISLKEIKLGTWNLKNGATRIAGMFMGCKKLESCDMNFLNFQSERCSVDINFLFEDCNSLEKVDISAIPIDDVIRACGVLKGCKNLKEICMTGNLDSGENRENPVTREDIAYYITAYEWFKDIDNLERIVMKDINDKDRRFMQHLIETLGSKAIIVG